MMGGFQSGRSYESEVNKREEELREELSRQKKNTTAQRVFWVVVGIALLLFLIVMIVGANVFHW